MNDSSTLTSPRLMPCPDCAGTVSKRAKVCPHCGAPLDNVRHEDLVQEQEISCIHPSMLNHPGWLILGIVTMPLLIGFLILIILWIAVLCTSCKLTNLRVIVCTGFIAKQQNEIWIKDMRNATLEQGVLQRIFGLGNVSIGTAATADSEIKINGIRNPQFLVDQINSLRHR